MLHKKGNIRKCYMRKSPCYTRESCPIFFERQQGDYMTLRNIQYINTLQKHSFYVAITMIFRLFYIINTVSLVISKFFL